MIQTKCTSVKPEIWFEEIIFVLFCIRRLQTENSVYNNEGIQSWEQGEQHPRIVYLLHVTGANSKEIVWIKENVKHKQQNIKYIDFLTHERLHSSYRSFLAKIIESFQISSLFYLWTRENVEDYCEQRMSCKACWDLLNYFY